MAITLPDARQVSDEVLRALRLRALHACESGYSETEVAELLGVARETVCRWWAAYCADGLTALPDRRTGRPVGSGRTLTEAQAGRLQEMIDQNSPEALGIASPLWTRRAVQELIHNKYGIDMPVRTVGEYLQRWGYTAKRPRRHARDQDPFEVRQWLEQTYPAIQARAEAENAEIHFGDETGVAADHHPAVGYARCGQPATMDVPERHVRINMLSTISNEGTLRFMTYQETLTAALFIAFLGRLVRGASRKIFLIVDRHTAHDAAAVTEWVDAHQDQIELFFLPKHSPELNADEYLNNDLKGSVNATGLPHDRQELRSRIQSFMHRLGQLPERIMSYFQHPFVQYAAGL
jgi:transposase